ncbi:MAG TPA: 2'-5' RNA ligase family protein [Phycisphaerae bacterium]|nr:2'-5' RNA ligase family protein [Phycisphaerae bacterium]
MMPSKTHKTAVVLIPPEAAWEPIQAIRREHDRQFRRWMPHVTLLYPFRPADEFDAVAPALAEACRAVAAFEVELRELGHFAHHKHSFTFWLRPEPAEKLAALHAALLRALPDCDDTARHAGGFQPHLSLGQAHSRRGLRELLERLGAAFSPIRFAAERVFLIKREDPPDDVFAVDRAVSLGG